LSIKKDFAEILPAEKNDYNALYGGHQEKNEHAGQEAGDKKNQSEMEGID
jgi:hypothetical protein